MADEGGQEGARTNLDRLDDRLNEGGLAEHLLRVYREALRQGAAPSASLRQAIGDRLAEMSGPNAGRQDQQD